MRKAIKTGIFFYVIIQLTYWIGPNRVPQDKDYIIDQPMDSTKIPNGDTAIHYKQDFTPMLKRKGKKPLDVNIE